MSRFIKLLTNDDNVEYETFELPEDICDWRYYFEGDKFSRNICKVEELPSGDDIQVSNDLPWTQFVDAPDSSFFLVHSDGDTISLKCLVELFECNKHLTKEQRYFALNFDPHLKNV